MRKLLLCLLCICAFVSCSQDEVVVTAENDSNRDAQLRSVANPMRETNVTDLYEYAAFSSNGYVDFSYSTTKSNSISHDGRTYYFERKVARVFKDEGTYHGWENCFTKIALYYHPTLKIHRVGASNQQYLGPDVFGNWGVTYVKVRELGYTLNTIFDEDKVTFKGKLDSFTAYYSQTYKCYRCYTTNAGDQLRPLWNSQMTLGIVFF